MNIAVKTWIELGWLGQDSAGWRRFVVALCSSVSEEESE